MANQTSSVTSSPALLLSRAEVAHYKHAETMLKVVAVSLAVGGVPLVGAGAAYLAGAFVMTPVMLDALAFLSLLGGTLLIESGVILWFQFFMQPPKGSEPAVLAHKEVTTITHEKTIITTASYR
jgi:hypothetical protein